ncbi:MAG TPA: RNA methyltransferase, partial [Acidimicrobiales bacterium]|nr:RNA methyltransferase [Acidimicrobiales bacterium]
VRQAEGAFVVEGARVLVSAIDAGAEIEAVFVGADGADAPAVVEATDRARAKGVRIFNLAPGVVERVADTVTPQPLLAVVRMPEATLGDLAGASFVVVCVDVRDPGNAGAVIRSADAAGADGVVCCAGTVDPFNPKTVRASAGSVLHLPVVTGDDPGEVLGALAGQGLRCLAAVAHGGTDYTEVDLVAPLALVFGNEAAGLPAALDDKLAGAVTIPMAGRAESLNVSMAAAVLCFEVRRARAGNGGLQI